MPAATIWCDPVRYAEVEQQEIVFNAHYLTYADEAMGAYCGPRGQLALAGRVHLNPPTPVWSAPAH